ncbi:HD domain-containing protein [bacterium]|nr:HD domain-containing protein [bacterium]
MKNNRESSEFIEIIFSYITQISAERSPDVILMLLADMGRQLVRADRCTVWVVSKDKQYLWTKVAHGLDHVTIPIDSGVVGEAVINNKRLIIDDAYNDERFNPEIDKQTGYKTKTLLVIPMHNSEGEIIGAFQVVNKLDGKLFTNDDLRYIMLAATYAAETVVTSLLVEEIEQTQKEVVFTMGAIGESRSKETGNHVKRVAEYSYLLATLYGMDEEEALRLKEASPMHDIGKVAIPDAVLNKPGRFDEAERKIMDTHAELGYEMLKSSSRALLKAAAIVAYEHHEKWDGTGYPRKLAGEDTHIYGRITALADVFDALGSDRVYKKAWDDEKIFELFKEERGKHFEPKLIDIFFEHKDKFLEIREKFADRFSHE